MTAQFKIKRFNELSATELYEILQLRSEVFVVEQDCVYQDVDGKDANAVHVFLEADNAVAAYCRLFAPGYYFENSSIGRVVIGKEYRDRKWGHAMMKVAIEAIKAIWQVSAITISAQLYLKKFYESHGFVQDGDQYLEDGIPHIRMHRG